MKEEKKISIREVKSLLADAYNDALKIAQKNCDTYIAWNPGRNKERMHDKDIENCGINSLYYRMIEQLEKV